MTHLNLIDPVVRAQYPAAGRMFDTLVQCFREATPKQLAQACCDQINALGVPLQDRVGILGLAMAYAGRSGGEGLANQIINDVLYETWDKLSERYNLIPLVAAESATPQTWESRVSLIHLIAETARQMTVSAVGSRIAVLSDVEEKTSDALTALAAIGVTWGMPPTLAEIEGQS